MFDIPESRWPGRFFDTGADEKEPTDSLFRCRAVRTSGRSDIPRNDNAWCAAIEHGTWPRENVPEGTPLGLFA
jgi:hypothetical protein